MSQVNNIETATTSDVDDRNVCVLRDEELDAVVGGKAGKDKQNYMVVTMSDCLITSV
jgi:hypothetical protein